MPKVSEMKESKFLRKEDVGGGALLTVKGVEQHNVAMQGAEPDHKWCMTFTETDKPLVLNGTNLAILTQILGSDDTDDWHGKSVVLYTDPNVSFGGKIVGGIRVRAPKGKAMTAPPAKPKVGNALADMEDDIPFLFNTASPAVASLVEPSTSYERARYGKKELPVVRRTKADF